MVVIALLLVVVALGAGLAGGSAGSASGSATSLTITYWANEEASQAPQRWTLRCNPVGGTLRTPKIACARLSRMTRADFAPVPPDAVCTQIYGGPQKAVVKGTFHGKPLWTSFRRRNGCEIDRWQRFSPWLIPPASTSS